MRFGTGSITDEYHYEVNIELDDRFARVIDIDALRSKLREAVGKELELELLRASQKYGFRKIRRISSLLLALKEARERTI